MDRGRRPPSGLDEAISATLDKRRSSSTIRQLTTNDPTAVDFSSNDFLSLASCTELREVFLQELEKTSPSGLGSGGSRLLDGNSKYAERLEHSIAAFHRGPAGLLCNSGFDANVGLYSCLPQPGDIIVYDEFIHASVHDGMKLSRAGKCIPFAHNDVAALAAVLQDCRRENEARQIRRNVFIGVETVYSMDGDLAPLRHMVDVIKTILPHGNGHLIVDEAHSTGIYGPNGAGLVSELGLEDEVTVRLHTFGKALACNGAILLCSPLIRQYLVNYARPLIYTTFMSYPALAAIKASYRFMSEGWTVERARNLRCLIRHLHDRLIELQDHGPWCDHRESTVQGLLRVPPDCPQSPIFSVLTPEPKALAAFCQSRGFIVRGIVPPTVPLGAERVRVCLHAGNTVKQIDDLVLVIREWVVQRLEATRPQALSRPRL